MSTSMRRTLAQALALLSDFENLIKPTTTCEVWTVAGSVRRKRPDVGDVDIVCIPRFGEVPADDMFATPATANLLWKRVDDLLKLGTFAKHSKDTTAGPRLKWGDVVRSIEFRGCAFEIETCDADNYGPKLAIRTGPEATSKEIVNPQRLPKYGYSFRDCFHLYDTRVSPAKFVRQVTEEQVFKMAGIAFLPPEDRR